jgi:tetratricopeptide (TPR) repeat protein
MRRVLSLSLVSGFFLYFAVGTAMGQTSTSAAGPGAGERAVALAESGHCTEALPLLKKTIRQTTNKELQKRMGLVGMHCAMTHDTPYDSLTFLEVLTHEFPSDPEVMYSATHAFSDLSLMSSQQLAREAPFSYQVHLLNAEALELQGKWNEAVTEYKRILDINPLLPGIHARLGRALLSEPQPTPETVAQAKKAFEDELEIDPRNASAEYVLGELAKNDNDLSAATRHYARATALDSDFAEAFLGLGTSLVSSKRFADAIPPLERYEKLAPDSPSGHFQLALAYSGVGRKDDANREAALQRETAASLEKVRRRVAEGLLEKQDTQGDSPSSGQDPPK